MEIPSFLWLNAAWFLLGEGGDLSRFCQAEKVAASLLSEEQGGSVFPQRREPSELRVSLLSLRLMTVNVSA